MDTSLVSNPQSFSSELLQPLVQSVCRGFKGALLLCGASTPEIHHLVDARVIKQVNPHSQNQVWLIDLSVIINDPWFQVLTDVFDRVASQVKGGWFTSVSSLQVIRTGGKTSEPVFVPTLLNSVEESL